MTEPKSLEKALFAAARELENAEDLDAFLEQTCRGNDALRERLERLLAVDRKTDDFFSASPEFVLGGEVETSASPAEAAAPDYNPMEAVPTVAGRYRLVERLGEGGCGIVYLAEQQEPVSRQVALKVIRLGMDTERVIARFQLERQTLAMMNHPHIAQVLDAGATESGRLYFVMELVQGIRITDYCDRHCLGTPSRLDLFVKVCLAIQHAHQKGILHRDIKPSNILVAKQDGVPVPKVIDFGIAKAVEGRTDTTFTAHDQFIGTPAYMSPEQADPRDADVDTRSDVYSLGALLYELLTGRPPFDPKKMAAVGVDEMRRILRETDPPAPSRLLLSLTPKELMSVAARHRTDPSRLLAMLRGDLDWIVMKALEKDRQRRYATANGLAADIGRYLNNEPVLARPPTRLYQFGKLIKRNRAEFLGGLAVLIALLVGLSASIWFLLEEKEALHRESALRKDAEKSEKLARAVFLVRDGNFDGANELLTEIGPPPLRPSLDGVTAYRATGDWFGEKQQWKEAADRYACLVRINQLDLWSPVTLDYQAYGVLLMEAGDTAGYARFCRYTAGKYAKEENGDAVGRVLKTCLLRLPDPSLRQALQPLGNRVTDWFSHLPRGTGENWATIPVALWWYRTGDLPRAEARARASARNVENDSPRYVTVRLILALIDFRNGKSDEGRLEVDFARKAIESAFARKLVPGAERRANEHWYDWAFAQVLLREAEAMAERPK